MNKKLIVSAVMFCVFVICPATNFSQTSFTEISGRISHRGIAIPNAAVTVINIRRNFSRTTTADTSGFFKFTQLPVDRYTITASFNAFGAKTRKIIAGIGGSKIFNLDLDVNTDPGSLSGKVTDKDEKVIGNVSLTLASKDNPENKIEVEIDKSGSFSIPELAQGVYVLTFKAEGFETEIEEVKVKSKKKKIEVELKKSKTDK